MNKFFFVVMMALVITSCASSKKVADTGDRDGTSFEKAIIAKSISSEYDWIREHYPNSQVMSQALVSKNGKPYDVLTVNLLDGSTIKVHFDISKFFGKGF